MRATAPAATGHATVAGARHFYRVVGDPTSGRTPLLLLHGSLMSADAMAPLVDGFARTRPVVALDPRGHGRTPDVVGDADGMRLAHAIRLYVLRGGRQHRAAVEGFLPEAPRARLAVLPATSHVGMLARARLVLDLVTPFLDDETPPLPDGFLQPGPGKPPAEGPTP